MFNRLSGRLFFGILICLVLLATLVSCDFLWDPSPTPRPSPTPTPAPLLSALEVGDLVNLEARGVWRVLEVNEYEALLLSNTSIGQRRIHSDIGVTWADSDIRAWLNDYYLNVFTEEVRARIISVTNSTNDNPWQGTSGGEDTTDYIFLLSVEEVIKFFGDSGQLDNFDIDRGYISDRYNRERIGRQAGETYNWWLRTPGFGYDSFIMVNGRGWIMHSGVGKTSLQGIRPALWLNIED